MEFMSEQVKMLCEDGCWLDKSESTPTVTCVRLQPGLLTGRVLK
jgi:hypothetical protein